MPNQQKQNLDPAPVLWHHCKATAIFFTDVLHVKPTLTLDDWTSICQARHWPIVSSTKQLCYYSTIVKPAEPSSSQWWGGIQWNLSLLTPTLSQRFAGFAVGLALLTWVDRHISWWPRTHDLLANSALARPQWPTSSFPVAAAKPSRRVSSCFRQGQELGEFSWGRGIGVIN